MKGKHALIMVICCLIPLGLLLALPALGVSLGSVGFILLLLLCPLSHILLMRGMHKEHEEHKRNAIHQGHHQQKPIDLKQDEWSVKGDERVAEVARK